MKADLQQIKEDHAKELGYNDFEELFSECAHTGIDIFIDLIAQKYANAKLDEASGAVTLKIEREGKQILKGNYAYFADEMDCVEIDKDSILSLKDEI